MKELELKPYYITGVDNLVKIFYIPVLEKSVLYQRRTGYFNSRALALAARGLTGLLKNDGKMQLICSVELDEPERAALEDPVGFLERRAIDVAKALEQPYDEIEKLRFAILAELLARGKLEIKIAIPQSGGIYHEKAGIFHDAEGNIVAFNGSGNETPGGWLRNTESFHAYTSWGDQRHIKPEVRTFDALWNKQLPGTTVIPLPEAIKKQLIRFRNYYRDGFDEPIDPGTLETIEWTWTPELAYVFEAPRLWNHTDFAYGEVAVTPFEHQDYVASSVLNSWPPRCMLCDEVGLGKTIEAGLIIHGFLAAGRVDRVLILAPKNILKQWQLQLLTKFNIMSWRLEGNYVYGPQPDPDIPAEREKVDAENPFRTKPIMLVSSQLVRSERRKEQALALEYDLIIVDEAHHARARGVSGRRQPNLLLEALEELRLQTQGLIFMTATPIQLSRKELWDLLMILELPGRWQDEDSFDRFFKEVNVDPSDWRFLFEMIKDSIDAWGVNDQAVRELEDSYGTMDLHRLMQIIKDNKPHQVRDLNKEEILALKLLLFRHTPVYRMIYRNTRELLREYYARGDFKERLPDREPQDPDRVALTGSADDPKSELGLYHAIDEYVRKYYAKYEGIRKGLGFLMEVYRKRLTSIFYSIRKSLQRRQQTLREALSSGQFGALLREYEQESADSSDETPDEYARDVEEETLFATGKEMEGIRRVLQEEYDYLDKFLTNLQDLQHDSKFEYLQNILAKKFRQGTRKIIIFSQFKDTVDFLLEKLRPFYGDGLGSYSGDGGLFWENSKWKACSKQKIQELFMSADGLSLLVCTDAASEGLDLQACDTLINYDIPWNPMRIEQRIGRIDRIGQKSPKVIVHTLYYENTVEERVYARCLERIGYFKTTLGHLQPILLNIDRVIRAAALAESEEEASRIIEKVEEDLEKTIPEVNEIKHILELLNHYVPRLKATELRAPITQDALERVLAPRLSAARWMKEDSYWVKGSEVLTFKPSLIDSEPRSARLITPLSNLSVLFGRLPEVPDILALQNGKRLHKTDIDGLTAFMIEDEGRFYAVSRLEDIIRSSGEAHRSLEQSNEALVSGMNEHRRQNSQSQLRVWRNREKSWRFRAHAYLDKVLIWRLKSAPEAGIEGFDENGTAKLWSAYLADAERKNLREIVRISDYAPVFSKAQIRKRGRPQKTSPRSPRREEQLLSELRDIKEHISTLEASGLLM